MIVVDTSVWSLAFRRRNWPKGVTPGIVKLLQKLTREKQRVVVPGVVLQELLSGVKDPAQGERIKELGAIPFLVEIDEAPMVGYASFSS